MIIFMRNIMYKKNIYKIFLWLFLLMFVGGGIGIGFLQREKRSAAITVYGIETSREAYYKSLQAAEKHQQYYKSQGVTFADANPRRDAVRKIVKNGLEKKVMHDLGLHADEFYLQKTLNEYLRYLPDTFFDKNGKLDEEMFKRHISTDIEGLLSDIRHMSEKELLDGILDISQYASQFELDAQYNKEYSDKVIEVLSVSPKNYKKVVESQSVSDKELKSFYKKLKGNERFKTKAKRAGRYWVFDQGAYDISVTEKDVKKEYDKRKKKEYVLAPAEVQVRKIFLEVDADNAAEVKDRLRGIHQELKENPETFADVAKKVSEDKGTASKGGLLPAFKKSSKEHDPILVKKAFESLSEDGQISNILKVKGGYVLLQRVSRKNTEYKSLKNVKANLEKELYKNKFEKRFKQAAKRMISQVKYKPEMLQNFIDKHHGLKKELTLSVRDNTDVSAHLFRTEEGKYQVFFNDKGNGVILFCSKVEPSVLKPLNKVKADVESLYYDNECEKMMRLDIEKVLELSEGKSFEELGKTYNMKYEKGESKHVDGERKNDAILNVYQIQQEMALLQFPGDVAHVQMAHGDAVLRLESLSERNQDLFDARSAEMKETLYQAEKYKKRDAFIASLGRNAIINNKIEIQEEFKP